jgi:hypothetical protein
MALEGKNGLKGRKIFIRKPLYLWTPFDDQKKNINKINYKNNSTKNNFIEFCDAKPNTNGEDWFTTYVYDIFVDQKSIQHKYAYVECDYVK